MNITFIGNCQAVSLCFFFQMLDPSNTNISWILYGEEFRPHVGPGWSSKCRNKIVDYEEGMNVIKNSDVIVFQEMKPETSTFCNTKCLQDLKKESCKLIKIPCFYFDYNDFDNSLEELQRRENMNNVDVRVSTIIKDNRLRKLMLTINHPGTILLLEVMKELCVIMKIDFFPLQQYYYISNYENYMGLPV